MKKRNRKGLKVLDTNKQRGGGKFHEIKSGKRGAKGPKRKKLLPPWRNVRSEV